MLQLVANGKQRERSELRQNVNAVLQNSALCSGQGCVVLFSHASHASKLNEPHESIKALPCGYVSMIAAGKTGMHADFFN